MIDRRRVMTPSAHNGNIRRAQLRGVVTNDPRGAAHLPPVSRREQRYFYLFRGHAVARLLFSLTRRVRARWGVYTQRYASFSILRILREPWQMPQLPAFPRETPRCQLRGMALIPPAKREVPFTWRLCHPYVPPFPPIPSPNASFSFFLAPSCLRVPLALVKAPGTIGIARKIRGGSMTLARPKEDGHVARHVC